MNVIELNVPCQCGSGKPYRDCCCKKNPEEIMQNEINELLASVEDLDDMSEEEIHQILQTKQQQINQRPIADFCGMTSVQMFNWQTSLYDDLKGIKFNTPQSLTSSPIMAYLDIMIKHAMEHDGVIKLTNNGYLPTKIPIAVSLIFEQLHVSKRNGDRFGFFKGKKEADIYPLQITKLLSQMAGIFREQKNTLKMSLKNQKLYQTQGIRGFFIPMLTAHIYKFNWAYLDACAPLPSFQQSWAFLLWRLTKHTDATRLTDETIKAFPFLLEEIEDKFQYFSTKKEELESMIRTRFLGHFLEYWGFAAIDIIDNIRLDSYELDNLTINLGPLFHETFKFDW